MNESFGQRVARLRKEREVSQKDLGDVVGKSQATISRLERSSEVPDDSRLLAKIARAFDMSFQDLLGDFDPPPGLRGAEEEHEFFAFCPNPLCDSNAVTRRPNGTLQLKWKSGARYPLVAFGEINFCERCGTDLLKECESCGRPIRSALARYCTTCGEQLHDGPTQEEWDELAKKVPPPPEPEDDLPF